MKKGIHPENYRLVAFKDMSNNDIFLAKSTAQTNETVSVEGVDYPLVKLEISRTSHPYYTCLLYTSPSPRDRNVSRMPSSA